MVAIERNENISKREAKATESGATPVFARKLVEARHKPIAEALSDLLREIGISRVDDTLSVANLSVTSPVGSPTHARAKQMAATAGGDTKVKHSANSTSGGGEPNLFTGTVIVPTSEKPENMHAASLNHSRQAMMLRMEHLFDEVETRALSLTSPDSEVLTILSAPKDDVLETKLRLPSKPVVIGDALPVPAECPDSVEQLLEASLAHHNLGSFEDSLKFLEAARIQLADIERRTAEAEGHHNPTRGSPTPGGDDEPEVPERKLLFFDLDMYITLCKGNVYQSCGDDEQSLLHFMDGWSQAVHAKDKDWEIICLNSIGMLAYYNLRYDVSILCFHAVVNFRMEVIGFSFFYVVAIVLMFSSFLFTGIWREQSRHVHGSEQRGVLSVLSQQARRGTRALRACLERHFQRPGAPSTTRCDGLEEPGEGPTRACPHP